MTVSLYENETPNMYNQNFSNCKDFSDQFSVELLRCIPLDEQNYFTYLGAPLPSYPENSVVTEYYDIDCKNVISYFFAMNETDIQDSLNYYTCSPDGTPTIYYCPRCYYDCQCEPTPINLKCQPGSENLFYRSRTFCA
eukprot:gene4203-5263_t